MRWRLERGHIHAGLGDDVLRAGGLIPGMVASRSRAQPRSLSVTSTSIMPVITPMCSSMRSMRSKASWTRRVVGEVPVESESELLSLGPQPSPGQVGEDQRTGLAGDEGFAKRPAGRPQGAGGHRGVLDAGGLDNLLQPLDLPGLLCGEQGAVSGQVPEPADRPGRDERTAHQAVSCEFGEPMALEMSVLRPGRFFVCRALTSIRFTRLSSP